MCEAVLANKDEAVLANKDEIERFKAYIEIAKYAISICIALAAVCGVLIKLGSTGTTVSNGSLWIFGIGIVFNVVVFVVAHRLVSEATMGITHRLLSNVRDDLLSKINGGTYSLFVICFIGNLVCWTIAIGVVSMI